MNTCLFSKHNLSNAKGINTCLFSKQNLLCFVTLRLPAIKSACPALKLSTIKPQKEIILEGPRLLIWNTNLVMKKHHFYLLILVCSS